MFYRLINNVFLADKHCLSLDKHSLSRKTMFIADKQCFRSKNIVFLEKLCLSSDKQSLSRKTMFISRKTMFISQKTVFIARKTLFISDKQCLSAINIVFRNYWANGAPYTSNLKTSLFQIWVICQCLLPSVRVVQ